MVSHHALFGSRTHVRVHLLVLRMHMAVVSTDSAAQTCLHTDKAHLPVADEKVGLA